MSNGTTKYQRIFADLHEDLYREHSDNKIMLRLNFHETIGFNQAIVDSRGLNLDESSSCGENVHLLQTLLAFTALIATAHGSLCL